MNLTRLALDHSHFVAVLTIGLFLSGLVVYSDFPSQEDPEYLTREASITTIFPGLSPERVENLISRRVEQAVRKIPEVETITSSSKTGISVVRVSLYDRYFDLDPIWQDLRSKMDDLRTDLPDGAQGPHVNDDRGRVAVATIAITGEGFSLAEMQDVSEELRDELYSVHGTSRVDVHGIQDEVIYLTATDFELAHYGLSPEEIFGALVDQNVILPSGYVQIQGVDLVFEPTGNFTSLEDIEHLQVAIPGGGSAYLQDVVSIERGYVDPPTTPVYYDGDPAIVLAVSTTPDTNVISYGKTLRQAVRAFESNLPIGYQLSFATFQPKVVEESISEFTVNLYQTLAVVLAVVLVFLGLRTGLVVGLIVPLTILATMVFMSGWGIPLQRVSVAALIISLGLLVDNGIVMAEEIRSRVNAGNTTRDAAIGAGGELAMPLFTSSLTTILAFMPLMLAEDSSGEYARSLSQVVAIALLCSWFLALFVTPVLCFWFIKPSPPSSGTPDRADPNRSFTAYRIALNWALGHRTAFVGTMLVLLICMLSAFRTVPRQFFPDSERTQFLVYLELAQGTSVDRTDREAKELSSWLLDENENPEILDHVAYVGSGGPRFVLSYHPPDPGSHQAVILVNLRDDADVDRVMQRTRRFVTEGLPSARARVKRLTLAGGTPGVVELRVIGPELNELQRLAKKLEYAFYDVPNILDVRDDWGNRTAKIALEVDQARARRAGVTSRDIAYSLSTAFDGLKISSYRDEDKSIPIVLRLVEERRRDLDTTRTVGIFSQASRQSVPLVQLAYFDLVYEVGDIRRRDLERTIRVLGRHPDLTAGQLVERIRPAIDAISVPDGYRVEIGGETESSGDANSALFANLPMCFGGIVLLLVWQFNSVRRPLIIFLTIPLSLIGAVAGLLVAGASFGFMATLGLLSLAGIIINNAIVLIDRIDHEVATGIPPRDAVVEACIQRFRPILMTTLTTILGLIPLMLFGGTLWFSMTVVIMSGLGVGTVLTLGVVPVLYCMFFQVPERVPSP